MVSDDHINTSLDSQTYIYYEMIKGAYPPGMGAIGGLQAPIAYPIPFYLPQPLYPVQLLPNTST